jgi:hypothetical protein
MRDHSNSGRRRFIVRPSSYNCEVDVWVNGEKQPRESQRNPETDLYSFDCDCTFNGAIDVKLKVNSGSLMLNPRDAIGIYPTMYDQYEGYLEYRQHSVVDWVCYASENFNGGMIESGQTVTFKHLIPNGAEWVKVYFNTDEDRDKFISSRMIKSGMLDKCLIVPVVNYYAKDANASLEERTANLIKLIEK